MRKRVLLTGSGGYIGQILGPRLRDHGWDVTGLDSLFFDGCDLADRPIMPTAIVKDVRDVTSADLEGFDAVVHLAGISNDPVGELNPELTLDINYRASVRLAELAREAGVRRFVFSSSCSVYGARSAAPVVETDVLEPLTAYASSKILTEQAVSELASDNFCPVYLRNATVYGVSPRLRFDLVVNNLVGWAHTTGQIRIMSDGSPWRPLIHVQDVSGAFVAALDAPIEAVWNQSFNIGRTDANYTVREIAEYVREAMPQAELTFSDSPPADSRSYKVDFSKAARQLPGFQPSWDLRAGVVELRDAFRACKLTMAEFDGPRFTRLKHLLQLQQAGQLTAELRTTTAARPSGRPLTALASPVAQPAAAWTVVDACRACGGRELIPVLDLGRTPLANALLPADQPDAVSPTYPLNVVRCAGCTLLQLREIVPPETMFSDYAYFSSTNPTLVQHGAEIAEALTANERLGSGSLVMEIASNDGYLLRSFKARGVPILGIEPAANIAALAEEAGIPTRCDFFGLPLAEELQAQGIQADVLLGNNVLAHVPELAGFAAAVARVVKPDGLAVFEFPYVKNMLDEVEFDTIYHEHQCYFSLTALSRLFAANGLHVHDVERIPIHGGSLRLSLSRAGRRAVGPRVTALLEEEQAWGVETDAPYRAFASSVASLKAALLELLDRLAGEGKRLAAYGAAAKGVTLSAYCGIGRPYLEYVVDRSPYKQQARFPIDALPICPPERLLQDRPDFALLFTWNFAADVLRQQRAYTDAGGRFIVPVPAPHIEP